MSKYTLTVHQIGKLKSLRQELAQRTVGVGSMHAAWDYIFDIDAVIEGKRAFESDPDKLISACQDYLNRLRYEQI